MVTGRAGRSISMPSRAYSYSGLPWCLSAEYMDGTCWISPRNCSSTVSTCASVNAGTVFSSTTAPSLSPVSVRIPSRAVVTYALSLSSMVWENLVASPKHSGKTPVASGSSAPVWPALAAPYRRLTCCRIPLEVTPWGLSITRMPFTSRPLRLRLKHHAPDYQKPDHRYHREEQQADPQQLLESDGPSCDSG